MTNKNQRWLQNLKVVTAILQQHDLESFLDTGTLLGAVRDKGFIPWDNDIDISIIASNLSQDKLIVVSEAIFQAGFNVSYHHDAIYVYKDPDIAIGIMLYRHKESSYVNQFGKIEVSNRFVYLLKKIKSKQLIYCKGYSASYQFKNLMLKLGLLISLLPDALLNKSVISHQSKQIKIPENFFKQTEKLNFYGIEFNVPTQPEQYLEYRYGSDWKTPISEYDYMTDDQSLVPE